MNLAHVDLSGARAWRLIPTRVPSADLLARVADPSDYDLPKRSNREIDTFKSLLDPAVVDEIKMGAL